MSVKQNAPGQGGACAKTAVDQNVSSSVSNAADEVNRKGWIPNYRAKLEDPVIGALSDSDKVLFDACLLLAHFNGDDYRGALRVTGEGPMTQGEIAKKIGKSRGSVSRGLNRLRDAGLMEVTAINGARYERVVDYATWHNGTRYVPVVTHACTEIATGSNKLPATEMRQAPTESEKPRATEPQAMTPDEKASSGEEQIRFAPETAEGTNNDVRMIKKEEQQQPLRPVADGFSEPLCARLTAYGIDATTATALLNEYDFNRIGAVLDFVDEKRGAYKNPPGVIIAALKRHWDLSSTGMQSSHENPEATRRRKQCDADTRKAASLLRAHENDRELVRRHLLENNVNEGDVDGILDTAKRVNEQRALAVNTATHFFREYDGNRERVREYLIRHGVAEADMDGILDDAEQRMPWGECGVTHSQYASCRDFINTRTDASDDMIFNYLGRADVAVPEARRPQLIETVLQELGPEHTARRQKARLRFATSA